jgi:PST family polysaccharide transporter
VGPQLIGAIVVAAAGWWLQTTALTGYSSFVRILLSGGFCICLYLAVLVGLFRLVQPIKVARSAVRELLGNRSRRLEP